MVTPSVDKLVEIFENPRVPPTDGKPTYSMLHIMYKLINSNVLSFNTNLGCSILGHLCLILSPTFYATLSTTRVVPPTNTRATPVIPAGTNRPEAASICYTHDVAMLVFNTFSNVDRALRQKLLGAVEDTFVKVKHKRHRGYSGSRTLDLLTRLYKTYAVISNSNWIANNKRFCKA